MSDRFRNGFKAAALASLAGGPFMAAMIAVDQLQSGVPIVVDQSWPHALPLIGAMTLFGWFYAILPNLLGTTVMGWLGRFNIGFRQPGMWAIIGGAAGGLPFAAASDAAPSPVVLMAGVGAASALLCYTFVRWEEVSVD